jgi:gamma-glutamyltranspeptidase
MTEAHHMPVPPERRPFRPTVLGLHAMVATPHYLASAAGLRVLHGGGNAIDAAIAAAVAVTQSQEQWTIRDTMDAANTLGTLQQFEGFRQTYLTTSGAPYQAGERMRQPALAQTFKAIASQGSRPGHVNLSNLASARSIRLFLPCCYITDASPYNTGTRTAPLRRRVKPA